MCATTRRCVFLRLRSSWRNARLRWMRLGPAISSVCRITEPLKSVIHNADPMKTKQLNKGIDQLMDEGVAQLFVNQFNGRKIIGTVGQLQFEVIQYRLENEYNAKCRWEPVSLYKACWIESDDPEELEAFKKRKYQYMAKDRDGRDVFLADSGYVLQMAQMDFKHIKFHFTSEF